MRIILYPYKIASESARKLAGILAERTGLRTLRVHPDGRYRYRRGDVVINWGNSSEPLWRVDVGGIFLNRPSRVALASNKLATFQRLTEAGVPTVPWTTDPRIAGSYERVYVRHELSKHSGEGIEIIDSRTNAGFDDAINLLNRLALYDLASVVESRRPGVVIPHAPLYTRGVHNHGEYRVHVFRGEVIDYRKKSRERGDVPSDGQSDIRTLGNGWIYRTSNLRRLERVEELAKQAITALGLDFGAVDIIKDEEGNVMVLEVNTAVGCDDTTASNYADKIVELINGAR